MADIPILPALEDTLIANGKTELDFYLWLTSISDNVSGAIEGSGDLWGSVVTAGQRKNILINGALFRDCWQRGENRAVPAFSSYSAAEYTADRWLMSGTGVGVVEVNYSNSLLFEGRRKDNLNIVNNVTGNSQIVLSQIIQGLLNEGEYTFSVLASFSSNLPAPADLQLIVREVDAGRATVNTFVSGVVIGTMPNDGTTARYTYTFTLPDLGASQNNLSIQLVMPSENYTLGPITITELQLERGNQFTSFERNSVAEDLALCRYYTRASDVGTRASEYSYEMRATPSVSAGPAPFIYDAEL